VIADGRGRAVAFAGCRPDARAADGAGAAGLPARSAGLGGR
jgi:hypothetical protein